jgi:hypothetical protein
MPSADELALAGMSDAEAQRWLKYYNDQQAAAMYSGGSGGSGRSSGGSGNGSNGGTDDAILADAAAFASKHQQIPGDSYSATYYLGKKGYTEAEQQKWRDAVNELYKNNKYNK